MGKWFFLNSEKWLIHYVSDYVINGMRIYLKKSKYTCFINSFEIITVWEVENCASHFQFPKVRYESKKD